MGEEEDAVKDAGEGKGWRERGERRVKESKKRPEDWKKNRTELAEKKVEGKKTAAAGRRGAEEEEEREEGSEEVDRRRKWLRGGFNGEKKKLRKISERRIAEGKRRGKKVSEKRGGGK